MIILFSDKEPKKVCVLFGFVLVAKLIKSTMLGTFSLIIFLMLPTKMIFPLLRLEKSVFMRSSNFPGKWYKNQSQDQRLSVSEYLA